MPATFLKWYVGRLKTHPMSTNMSSALVLMVAGDILAQEIELSGEYNERTNHQLVQGINQDEVTKETSHTTLHYRRYGRLSPNVEGILENEMRKHKELDNREKQPALQRIQSAFHTEAASIDLFRTATMVTWSAAVQTPFYVGLYMLFDRFLPTGATILPVLSRVALTFFASIPVNAVFFCYGTAIHHVTEWVALVMEWRSNLQETNDTSFVTYWDIIREEPFDLEMAWSSCRLKLEAELYNTIIASGSVWIPINTFNFSLVPPHLRPLTLMVCSVFWNCYLSLAQHRNATLPE